MARPARNPDLHHNAPDDCPVALLLIDVLNCFDYPGGATLAREAEAIAARLVALRRRARGRGVPVIYVNDNCGRWRSDLPHVLRKACASSRGGRFARLLRPGPADYVVLKPKQSAFYATPLETLLDYLKVRRLVLAGLTTEICVYFTAQDAFLRDYELWIPRDGTVSGDRGTREAALGAMQRNFKARVVDGDELDWKALQS